MLGGGLAGLQIGRLLKERGVDCVILESREEAGGLCRTFRRGAHSWDIGPHAYYSRDPGAMRHFESLPVDYVRNERRVRVCHRSGERIVSVSYPFENGLADLPWGERLECLGGALRARLFGPGQFHDLRHWITEGLGTGIARHFMLPYNEKIWDCPLERISMDLVSRKIEPEPVLKLIRNTFVRGTVGRAYQARFLYPRSGAGALTDAIARTVGERLQTHWRVSRLEPAEGGGWRIFSEGGSSTSADAVVSTIPVPELLAALGDPALQARAAEFRGNDTFIVAVGLKEGRRFRAFGDCHWVFFAGPESFYRLTFTRSLKGEGPDTAAAEITRRSGAGSLDTGALTGRVLADLRAAGILADEADVEFSAVHLERHTYPIPTLGLEAARREVEESLAARGIFLLGRSGRWEYLNTDGIFLAAERFMSERLPALLGNS
ncbi:MAG: hypothetical protein A2X36_10985 [Elusimicrobia bacterium GWA2_69_24]|nr:MAG: hypothetical protein A2X36_10985 [Elusimicrobia bacterium GWA2_69_24]